jgi:hypothetical protein
MQTNRQKGSGTNSQRDIQKEKGNYRQAERKAKKKGKLTNRI